ncbi:MAG: pyruvate, phosphate dikinase [bacterium]
MSVRKGSASKKKYVYAFGGGKTEGRVEARDLLGGKGANLAEMSRLGIPVPPGFTITTEVCLEFLKLGGRYPSSLRDEVAKQLARLERELDAAFGDAKRPLLLSVRSGARMSMPGMMDTILNIGLNDDTVRGLAAATNNPRMAFDSYRRFVQMYGDVVLEVEKREFENLIDEAKARRGVALDTDLDASDLEALAHAFKALVRKHTGREFPSNPSEQLWGAIGAVFSSWKTQRAVSYRKLHNIGDHWGTAANVQAMVFGNMGDTSATGVAFTRDPSTGERKFYGEYLRNAQGEDVVAGVRTPLPINIAARGDGGGECLETEMPEAYRTLESIYQRLEKHYREMQDIEFTIQEGRLWMLQTRTGKRTAMAAVRIAVEMAEAKLITKDEAVMRVAPGQLDQLLHPMFDPTAKKTVIAKGLAASPGAASGKAVFNADDAEAAGLRGERVILVRRETSPEDIHGMAKARGILTARGGMTSHAAVVARGMGKCCVAGCNDIAVEDDAGRFTVKGTTVSAGDWISLDGSTGQVMLGEVPTTESQIVQVLQGRIREKDSLLYQQYQKLMSWADKSRRLKVRTNADTPEDAEMAVKFGAEGIGLCRTEHMFFEADRIAAVREMILAADEPSRRRALAKLLPMQRRDFAGIFKAMRGFPVTIRTLDPPLHEFLPHADADIAELAREIGVSFDTLKAKVVSLHEMNPMLGHRGCRLGIAYPEITEMQARAIFEAAAEVAAKGIDVKPEIMIPLVGHRNELALQSAIVHRVAKEVFAAKKSKVKYLVGTMIELPRAALTAGEIALEAEFFSYGTNDLTQTTFGLSRDDAGKFLPLYVDERILEADPFQTVDRNGVGLLMKIGTESGRAARPGLKVGICGEHGGDPASVEFCHELEFDYVSCSPYRVPIARLAAAQAMLKERALAKPGAKNAAKRATPKGASKSAKKSARKPAKKK